MKKNYLEVPTWANNQNKKYLKREALKKAIYEDRVDLIKDWLCFIIPIIIVALVVIL